MERLVLLVSYIIGGVIAVAISLAFCFGMSWLFFLFVGKDERRRK